MPPCGGHRALASTPPSTGGVSSRAPVWGASEADQQAPDLCCSFKSCPRVGSIVRNPFKPYHQESFKSCPRVGGISAADCPAVKRPGFKSCPRVGGIAAQASMAACWAVSSRAPVWGASAQSWWRGWCGCGFKSCPRVGGILQIRPGAGRGGSFKSCPRVGGIARFFPPLDGRKGFKSCPRVGGIVLQGYV